jgi:ribosomal protein S18 acetylase RimI-like enzyme
MSTFTVKALDGSTWNAFSTLVEQHNGVWGGCWCLEFHPDGGDRTSVDVRRASKCSLVESGRAHAALVFEGDAAIGWCQFGSPDELPRIKHRGAYEAELAQPPDWRITCFFVHKRYRGRGVASVALDGALAQIAGLGGGIVESYPEDTSGRDVQGRLLHNVSVSLFEKHGFTRTRPIGKRHWVVTKKLLPTASP